MKAMNNAIKEAIGVLKSTDLDYVVWYDGNNYNLYEKNVDL